MVITAAHSCAISVLLGRVGEDFLILPPATLTGCNLCHFPPAHHWEGRGRGFEARRSDLFSQFAETVLQTVGLQLRWPLLFVIFLGTGHLLAWAIGKVCIKVMCIFKRRIQFSWFIVCSLLACLNFSKVKRTLLTNLMGGLLNSLVYFTTTSEVMTFSTFWGL